MKTTRNLIENNSSDWDRPASGWVIATTLIGAKGFLAYGKRNKKNRSI